MKIVRRPLGSSCCFCCRRLPVAMRQSLLHASHTLTSTWKTTTLLSAALRPTTARAGESLVCGAWRRGVFKRCPALTHCRASSMQRARPWYMDKLRKEKAATSEQTSPSSEEQRPVFSPNNDTKLKLRYRPGAGGCVRVRVVPREVRHSKHINQRKRRR